MRCPPGLRSKRSTARALPGRAAASWRQSLNGAHRNKLYAGDPNTDGAGQFQHDEFVLRDRGKVQRGELDDPRTANALGGNREAAGRLPDGGEIELNTGERKAQRATVPFRAGGRSILIAMFVSLQVERRHSHGSGEVRA